MPLRDRIRKFKSDVKSRMFHVDELKDNRAGTEQHSVTSASGTSHSWTHLKSLLRILEQAVQPLPPLKAAVTEIVGCIDIYESVSHERKEYEALYNELEQLFQTLQILCTRNIPPAVTTTVESLCKSVHDDMVDIRRKLGQGKQRAYLEAEQDMDAVLNCYHRTQLYLQRISLNMDVEVWRVVDETATDNRLKNLSPSLSARFNSAQAVELKRGPCTEGTRVDLISRMLGWADSSSLGSVFWMSGMAGTGKTTTAYSLCLKLDASQRLAASFFCSRLLPECRDVNLIVPSIAYQLARFSRPFRQVVSGVLEKDPDVHTQLPHIQFDALIAQPLLQIKHTLPDSLVIVIDALDECENKESTSRILGVLLVRSSDLPVKFVVSSRPEPAIRDEMVKQDNQTNSRVVLHELDGQTVRADIETYLRVALAEIQLNEEQIGILVKRAGILFIYAATVVRYISHDRFRRNPRARLVKILESSGAPENKHKEIDELYTAILQAAIDDPSLEGSEREDMRQVLHTVICTREPLAVETLSGLLRMNDTDQVRAALRPLWSVLHVSGASELVTTLHASFSDYMLDPLRSKQYSCDITLHNQAIARLCFDCFHDVHPKFNICSLESSYVPDDKIEGLEARVQVAISEKLFYASKYWAAHLCSSTGSGQTMRQLEEFLSTRAMSRILWMVDRWDKERSSELNALIHDAWRFTSAFTLSAVSDSTPHIYTSMLPFWPEYSPIAKCYMRRTSGLIKAEGTAINQRQHALLATWSFDNHLLSPTFSPDGMQVAVGVGSKVYLVNSLTGRIILPPFEGHNERVSSVQFSADGTHIASGSESNIIWVWCTQSGKTVLGPLKSKELSGIGYRSVSTAFSPDGTRLVSASQNGVCVWDAFSGEPILDLPPLGNHDHWTQWVKYSPNGREIAVLGRWGIEICDGQNGHVLRKLGSDYYSAGEDCTSVDISPDGTRIACGYRSSHIHVLDFGTGELVLGPLSVIPSSPDPFTPSPTSFTSVNSVTFSPNGSYLVCGLSDGVYMWDTRSGSLLLGPLGGRSENIMVGCSPDAAYIISSFNRTLSLWDTRGTHTTPSQLPNSIGLLTSICFSPDGTRVVSKTDHDYHSTVNLWDVESGEMVLGPLDQPRTYGIAPVVFSPKGSCFLANTGHGLMLFDTQTGSITLGPLGNPQNALQYPSARFSPDGCYIILGELRPQDIRSRLALYYPPQDSFPDSFHSGPRQENIIRILEVETGRTVMVLHLPPSDGGFQSLPFVTFSSDGAHIITHSSYKMAIGNIICVYDARNGRLLYDKLRGSFPSFRFSPDGTRVVSHLGSIFEVHDVRSCEKLLGPLEVHTTELVLSVDFSPDGRYIVSGANDHTVCIWDAQTGEPILGPVKWHTEFVKSVAFSLDGTRVASASEDGIIRVTDVRRVKVPDPSLQSIGEWELREDGWVVDQLSRLLVWIPPDLRGSLMWPRTKQLISSRGYLRLNYADAYIGESWAKCYQPA